jgi:tetratricopeptide (TPR) repeat protein
LIRNLSRRLERLEARAATGKWTHMDRAEEQPPESSELRIARKVRWPEKVTDGNFVRACCTVEVCHLTDSRFWRMVDDGIVRVHQRTPIGFQMIRLWSSRLRGFQMKQLLLCPALFFLALPSAPAQIIVSGKVAVAEGGQLPDRVIIQRDCGGAPRTAAYADRKGQFNFRWSETAGITGDDASQSIAPGGPRGVPGNGIGQDSAAQSRVPGNGPARIEPAMTGCELRAAAPGYLSEVVALDSNRAFFDNYDVGTIFLHRTGDAEGPPASGTSSKAPSDARKAFDKGLEALGKGKTPDAEKDFEKAVSLYPQYVEAWLDLGKLRLQRKADDSAREAFQKALEADANLVEPWVYLGMLAVEKKQWPDAAKYLNVALKLDPVHFPDAWFNNAVAGYNLKDYAGAEKSVREALRLDPQHKNPRSDYLLGLILAAQKDYSGAAEQLRFYLKLAPGGDDAEKVKTELAEIEKLESANHP